MKEALMQWSATYGPPSTTTPKTYVPISGMESDVAGITSATNSMKTVSERRTVIPRQGWQDKE